MKKLILLVATLCFALLVGCGKDDSSTAPAASSAAPAPSKGSGKTAAGAPTAARFPGAGPGLEAGTKIK